MKKKVLILISWIFFCLLSFPVYSQSNCTYDHTRQVADTGTYGSINEQAPEQLSAFAFLIGEWKCNVRIQEPNGNWSTYKATWSGRYILDGYAITDEFRMTDPRRELVMLGANYRSYNSKTEAWEMKWYDALSARWLNLLPDDLGGVQLTDSTVSYQTWYQPGTIHRMTFSDICKDRFRWTIDSSDDGGKTWEKSIMIINARRSIE